MKLFLSTIVCLLSSCMAIGLGWTRASAAPIYVIKEKSGVVRFTNKPPKDSQTYEVFTSQSGSYARYAVSNRYSYSTKNLRTQYAPMIAQIARSHGLDPALVKAVIHAESAFNPKAVSPKGAMGLMQLMPGTAREHGVASAFDPADNIKGGVRYLATLIKRYRGDLNLSLAAYNAGEGAVQQYGGIPPYSETKNYVSKVKQLHAMYQQQMVRLN